jgi:serine/threonine protein kinase
MKLSDFGLCKPLDCSNLSSINENEVLDDENLNDTMDIDGCFPDTKTGRRWKSPLEQLQHWQINRRKLVGKYQFLVSYRSGILLYLIPEYVQSKHVYSFDFSNSCV